MKKNLLFLLLIFLCTYSMAQQNLKQLIKGEKGISKHFVTLSPSEQMPFNPAAAKSLLGLDEKSNLVLMQNFTDNIGQTHYRYYQTYKGIAIENTMYILHTAAGKLSGLSGIIVTDFGNAMQQRAATASITPEKAISLAIDYVGAKTYMWQNAAIEARYKKQMANSNATYKPTATLVWYNAGTDINENDLQLAYKVDVYAKEPLSRAYYYVNAATGKIMGKKDELFYSDATGTANTEYSGSRTIHSDLYNGNYRLWDLTRGNGVITLHGDKLSDLDYTSTTSNWVLKNQNRHAMDVHFGVAATYDYFKAKFNRSSVDGNGIALISYVNDGEQDNAHWDGTSMNFGIRSANSKGVTGIDVTGHELTHGVTQYSCGLNYSYESGAMNESLSDIMGKSVQFYTKPNDINWQLSNDMGWIIRDMSNPNFVSQPDTYMGQYWYAGTGDNGGVHTNSGVGNFMFYLLSQGGSGTNDNGDSYAVTGIGLDKAQQIIYRTQTVYLTPTSTYTDWKAACISAATDLYGAAGAAVTQVKNAWHAVGVGDYYCDSYGYNTAYYFYIKRIKFSNIDNTSGDNGGYGDFTGRTAQVTKAQTYPIQMTAGYQSSLYSVNWTIYIDYNHDKDFNDANEEVAFGTSATTAAFTRYISIPSNALTGKTRMRIQMSYYGYEGPCGILSYGETEDYSININAAGKSITGAENMLTAKIEEKKNSLSVAPNPVTGSNALINYSLQSNGKTQLRIMDMYGKAIQAIDLGMQNAGTNTYKCNFARQLSPGIYIVLLEQNNKPVAQTKMLVATGK